MRVLLALQYDPVHHVSSEYNPPPQYRDVGPSYPLSPMAKIVIGGIFGTVYICLGFCFTLYFAGIIFYILAMLFYIWAIFYIINYDQALIYHERAVRKHIIKRVAWLCSKRDRRYIEDEEWVRTFLRKYLEYQLRTNDELITYIKSKEEVLACLVAYIKKNLYGSDDLLEYLEEIGTITHDEKQWCPSRCKSETKPPESIPNPPPHCEHPNIRSSFGPAAENMPNWTK